MPWVEATFKDKKVWALVDDGGRPVIEGGRRAIRYSDGEGAKVYRAGASGVVDGGAAARELPSGVSADAKPAPKKGGRGSGFGSAKTRTAGQAAAAAADFEERLAALPEGAVVAFTDGACTGNPGPCGSGAVVQLPDGTRKEGFRALGRGTNNVGELDAIDLALGLLEEAAVDREAVGAVFTDSSYARGVLVQGWKAKANQERIFALRKRLADWPGLEVQWVAGHAGIVENERADALARKGVEASRGR